MISVLHKHISRIAVYSILLSSCLVITSCADKSSTANTSPLITIQDFYETSESDFIEIKNSDYDNLFFENSSLVLPSDITEFSIINMKYYEEMQKESLTQFEKVLKETFSNNISNEDCFFNSPNIEVSFGDLTIEYPQLYSPSYYDKILNDTLPVDMYLYQTDTYQIHDLDQYFMMFSNRSLLKMNRGNFTRSVEKDRNLAGWMPRDNYPKYENVAIEDYNRTISFNDDNQAITEAVSYCNTYFKGLHLTGNDDLLFQVNDVNIIETDSKRQALLLFITRVYNGIPFDTLNSEGVFSEFSDGNEYYFDSSEALMCNADEIEYYYLTVNNSNIVSKTHIEEIISLKSAADIVSSYMTSNIKFDVENISLVYSNMIVDNSDYQSTAKPTWKFLLKNNNDNLRYMVFVDVETGACHYYTF